MDSAVNDKLYEYERNSFNFIIKDDINSLEDLEYQFNQYNNMVKEKRQESDEMSLMITGKTNIERYNEYINRFATPVKMENQFDNIIKFSDKAIHNAINWQRDSNIRIVYPVGKQHIDRIYNLYNMQHNDLKIQADDKCNELFGMDCEDLYNFIKFGDNVLVDIEDSPDYELHKEYDTFISSNSIEESYTDKMIRVYKNNKINKELKKRHEEMNSIKWEYAFSPYFSPVEIEQFSNYYSDRKNDSITEIAKEYKKAFYGLENNFDCLTWDDTVRKLIYMREVSTDPDMDSYLNQSLVDIGWNPEVDYTDENKLRAHNRINKLYSSQFNNVEMIDSTGLYDSFVDDSIQEAVDPSHYYPVSIILCKGDAFFSDVIVKFTDGPFSHSAICLDNDFNRLYSFNMFTKNKVLPGLASNGFSLESIKGYPQDNRIGIYTFFVEEEQYKTLSHNIQQYLLYQKSTKYSTLNLVTILFKNVNLNLNLKMICSQFVDRMLKLANVDITKMPSDKVTPNVLYHVSIGNSKIYKIYEGKAKDFNQTKAQRLINKIAKNAMFINECNFVQFSEEYFTSPIVTEARKSIIRVNQDQDVLLTTPMVLLNLDSEYSQSHKLLLNYDRTNDYEGMKYELCRLFYMNYILERRINSKISKKSKKDINTRARVLNDFNKYIKVVLKNQPNFNFSEYYEQSPFYHNTVTIDKDTLKYTTDSLKSLLVL